MALVMPTIESAPNFDGQAVPDSTDWQAIALAAQQTGVVSGMTVTQHTGSDMEISTAAGVCAVNGVLTSVNAAAGVSISAASVTDRRDIVIWTPGIGIETSGSSTTNSAACTGTPCGTAGWTHTSSGNPPVKPSLVAGSVLLGEVYVASTTTTITTAANIIDKTTLVPVSAGGLGVYGDGSDGAVTFNGTSTLLGIAPSPNSASNGVYTLTRDIYLATGSTLNSGISIVTNGYRVFCQGTFTNNGTIQWNGNPAVAGTAGAAISNANATLNPSNVGTVGGTGATGVGAVGTAQANRSLGGQGGTGGLGTSSGGAGGAITGPIVAQGSLRWLPAAATGLFLEATTATSNDVFGGSGGGAGGGDGSHISGSGGGGGGLVLVCARYFAGTGAIHARGGAGSAANASSTNGGGGGGGGGGLVIVVSSSIAAGAIAGQTIDANGGTGGAGVGAGAGTGSNGSAGTVILLAN